MRLHPNTRSILYNKKLVKVMGMAPMGMDIGANIHKIAVNNEMVVISETVSLKEFDIRNLFQVISLIVGYFVVGVNILKSFIDNMG